MAPEGGKVIISRLRREIISASQREFRLWRENFRCAERTSRLRREIKSPAAFFAAGLSILEDSSEGFFGQQLAVAQVELAGGQNRNGFHRHHVLRSPESGHLALGQGGTDMLGVNASQPATCFPSAVNQTARADEL